MNPNIVTVIELLFTIAVSLVVIGVILLIAEARSTPLSTKPWEPGDE